VQYPALRNRIWDEVRDRRRANPMSVLIRLSDTAEALGPLHVLEAQA
jgi:hypothetical protein